MLSHCTVCVCVRAKRPSLPPCYAADNEHRDMFVHVTQITAYLIPSASQPASHPVDLSSVRHPVRNTSWTTSTSLACGCCYMAAYLCSVVRGTLVSWRYLLAACGLPMTRFSTVFEHARERIHWCYRRSFFTRMQGDGGVRFCRPTRRCSANVRATCCFWRGCRCWQKNRICSLVCCFVCVIAPLVEALWCTSCRLINGMFHKRNP